MKNNQTQCRQKNDTSSKGAHFFFLSSVKSHCSYTTKTVLSESFFTCLPYALLAEYSSPCIFPFFPSSKVLHALFFLSPRKRSLGRDTNRHHFCNFFWNAQRAECLCHTMTHSCIHSEGFFITKERGKQKEKGRYLRGLSQHC